jgi:hypothetical protein
VVSRTRRLLQASACMRMRRLVRAFHMHASSANALISADALQPQPCYTAVLQLRLCRACEHPPHMSISYA